MAGPSVRMLRRRPRESSSSALLARARSSTWASMRPVTVSSPRSAAPNSTGARKAASHTPVTRPAVTSGTNAHASRFLPHGHVPGRREAAAVLLLGSEIHGPAGSGDFGGRVAGRLRHPEPVVGSARPEAVLPQHAQGPLAEAEHALAVQRELGGVQGGHELQRVVERVRLGDGVPGGEQPGVATPGLLLRPVGGRLRGPGAGPGRLHAVQGVDLAQLGLEPVRRRLMPFTSHPASLRRDVVADCSFHAPTGEPGPQCEASRQRRGTGCRAPP